MNSVLTVCGRMKWGFVPVRRVVDDHIIVDEDASPQPLDEKAELIKVSSSQASEQPTVLEYRDEKDRKWYQFFDEFEYRVKSSTKSRRKWYHWFHPDDTPQERRLILKLDLLLTLYSLLGYWIKFLDQTNLTNAYIGGMKESIHMKGNDFVHTQVWFQVGHIVFQIPFMYIIFAYPLNYVLPFLDLAWLILTIGLSGVKTVEQLQVLRFMIGSFEAPAFLAYHSLFASWFKSGTAEVARRACFYHLGQYCGMLTSGFLSGAIERNLVGVAGWEPWQLIFFIDGILSVFVGILGFYMIPGTPEDCYSPFLSDDDIRTARKRMRDDQKDYKPSGENPAKLFFNWDLWKSILSSWHIYVVVVGNILCWNNLTGMSGAYALWLKSLKNENGGPRFSPGTLQYYTALTPGLGFIWLVITSFIADLLQCRWAAIVFTQALNLLGNALLSVWYIPESAKWFAYCLQYWGWAMAPVLYSWQGDICRKDVRERIVVLVAMNIIGQQSNAWISMLIWKTVEAPRFLKGFSFTACIAFAIILWTIVVLWFYKRQERQDARENGMVLYNSATDPDSVPSPIALKSQ